MRYLGGVLRSTALFLAVAVAAACGDSGSPQQGATTPGASPAAEYFAGDESPHEEGRPPSPTAGAERRRVDTRARLDLTGLPDGVTVELDGQELAGVVLLEPGGHTIYVFAEGVEVGDRELELRSGETLTPDFEWALEQLAERREHLEQHPHHATDGVLPPLEWLVAHRSPDGMWRADGFADRCPVEYPCDGAVSGVSRAEATGCALLAFSAASETHESGRYRRVVRGAYEALARTQDAAGSFDAEVRGHAIATLAFTELCRHTQSQRFREPAQRAVDALVARSDPGGAWLAAGAPDAETTAWAALAIASGKSAALTLPESIEPDVLAGLASFGDPGGAQLTDRASALITLARILLGCPADEPAVLSGFERCVARPPASVEPADAVWVWAATCVAFEVGGKDIWKRWSRSLRDGFLVWAAWAEEPDTLFGHGSVPLPSDGPGGPGRVRSVAFSWVVSALYYRWDRVFGVTHE